MVIALAGGALRHHTAIAFALAPNLRQHVGATFVELGIVVGPVYFR